MNSFSKFGKLPFISRDSDGLWARWPGFFSRQVQETFFSHVVNTGLLTHQVSDPVDVRGCLSTGEATGK
jgi:hypothetical protein